jgi:hypothetical protein
MSDTQGLYTGIAVVIDDQIHENGSEIAQIVAAIRKEGGHVVEHTELPVADDSLVNLEGASFFILDWHLESSTLTDIELGVSVPIPDQLSKEQVREKIEFLLKLKEHRVAPVFIFTAAGVETVKQALKKSAGKRQKGGAEIDLSHILVMSKSDVLKDGVFTVLNDWTKTNASALALKSWEQAYQTAKNALFVDFYSASPLWPAILWKNFYDDGVPPSDQLIKLLSRNLLSRMVPIKIEMEPFMTNIDAMIQKSRTNYLNTLLDVLQGERFVLSDRLHGDSIAPGDVFKIDSHYFLNIRPECDCVLRDGACDLELYLLSGDKLGPAGTAKKGGDPFAGRLAERNDEALVFAMYKRGTFSFDLKTLHKKSWMDAKKDRIGRLLPPFLTHVQQRYSSYLMRPGLPKIPIEAMEKTVKDTIERENAEAAKKALGSAAQPAADAKPLGTVKPISEAVGQAAESMPHAAVDANPQAAVEAVSQIQVVAVSEDIQDRLAKLDEGLPAREPEPTPKIAAADVPIAVTESTSTDGIDPE